MPLFSDYPVATLNDVIKFESEQTLEQRYDARSVYDIFAKSAARHPDRTALTMLMTGVDDETPRIVTYRQMLDGITRAANSLQALVAQVPALPTKIIDATGAGDLFAGAFLWGLTNGYGYERAARMGNLAASEVISHIGARPEADLRALFRAQGLI